MSIYAYPMDETGCGKYRVIWPARAIDPFGDRIKILSPGENGGISANVINGKVTGATGIPSDCEAVIFQRPTNVHQVAIIPFLQAQGVKVIIDVDDDLALLGPRHPTWHGIRQPGHHPRAIQDSCQMADRVVASSDAILKRLAPHGRGVVVHNMLPSHFFDAGEVPEYDEPFVGWPGHVENHPDDLAQVGNSIARLKVPFRIWGPLPTKSGPYPLTNFRIPDVARTKRLLGVDATYTGPIEFEDWMDEIRKIYIGVAPLEMYSFNMGKSWLKPLELAAAGVPFVCTPTPEYRKLGAGLFAAKAKHWYHELGRLLDERSSLREEEIERNREIAQQHMIDDHLDVWKDAWML